MIKSNLSLKSLENFSFLNQHVIKSTHLMIGLFTSNITFFIRNLFPDCLTLFLSHMVLKSNNKNLFFKVHLKAVQGLGTI